MKEGIENIWKEFPEKSSKLIPGGESMG